MDRIVQHLQAAVASGALPEALYQALVVGERGVSVGGDLNARVIVTGDNNKVHYHEAATAPDETALLQAAVADYKRPFSAPAADSPYQGLQPYRLQDANRFFGRSQAEADVVALLQKVQVVWLHGQSGTGKSSLLQAGLRPNLQAARGLVMVARSFDELPTQAIKKELLRAEWSPKLTLATWSLLKFVTEVGKIVSGRRLYLFFDQFEEFFLQLSATDQAAFGAELAACVQQTELDVRFLFSLRSDAFGETGEMRERLPQGSWAEYRLRPLTTAEAAEAIEQPLVQRGISFAPGLVEQMVAELEEDGVALPQLQLVCEQLYQQLREGESVVTATHYEQLEGVKGVLTSYLQRVLGDQPPASVRTEATVLMVPTEEREAARYLLTTLVNSEGRRTHQMPAAWYGDRRWQPWALAWHARRLQLGAISTEADWQPVRDAVVEQLLAEVGLGVGLERKALAAYAAAEAVAITNKGFVDKVIGTLQTVRLLRETATKEGVLAYELIHDCLIEEIGGWLDDAERAARPVRELLVQAEVNMRRHGLWLDGQALTVVVEKLANPRLDVRDAEWRLLLLSAGAVGVGKEWLVRVGNKGLAWLQTAYGDEALPLAVREGAAATLGAVGDGEALDDLRAGAVRGEWVGLLAHYLLQTETMPPLPWRVRRAVAWPLLRLQVAMGKAERVRMQWWAMKLALLALVITMGVYVLRPFFANRSSGELSGNLLVIIVFGILGAATAFGFAAFLTSLDMLSKQWSRWWRVVGLTVVGGVPGFLLFLFMTLEPWTGFGGAVIGFVLGAWPQHKMGAVATWLFGVVGLGVAVVVWLLTATPASDRWVDGVAACVAGVYVFGYLLVAVGRNGRLLT